MNLEVGRFALVGRQWGGVEVGGGEWVELCLLCWEEEDLEGRGQHGALCYRGIYFRHGSISRAPSWSAMAVNDLNVEVVPSE